METAPENRASFRSWLLPAAVSAAVGATVFCALLAVYDWSSPGHNPAIVPGFETVVVRTQGQAMGPVLMAAMTYWLAALSGLMRLSRGSAAGRLCPFLIATYTLYAVLVVLAVHCFNYFHLLAWEESFVIQFLVRNYAAMTGEIAAAVIAGLLIYKVRKLKAFSPETRVELGLSAAALVVVLVAAGFLWD